MFDLAQQLRGADRILIEDFGCRGAGQSDGKQLLAYSIMQFLGEPLSFFGHGNGFGLLNQLLVLLRQALERRNLSVDSVGHFVESRRDLPKSRSLVNGSR